MRGSRSFRPWLLLLGIAVTACAGVHRAYDGPALERDQTARLEIAGSYVLNAGFGRPTATIHKVDDRDIDGAQVVEFVPGLHHFRILMLFPRSAPATPQNPYGIGDPDGVWLHFAFQSEPGKTYKFDYGAQAFRIVDEATDAVVPVSH